DILPNGIAIHGGTPRATGRVLETEHDHRTAMAAAVLACAAGPITIDRADSIDVSFPAFIPTLGSVQQS
ncbi:MAG: 3-phosphoshikimate 1-carboxyvinyltransferase, partial [Vulcanimicrobiaceae bacterium]